MRLDEREKPLVLLGLTEEFERDAASTHRSNHGGHFDRRFILGDDDFQVKNVVDMHLSFTLDDAPAQGEVQHHAVAPHFAPGKRQAQADRNTEVFPSLDRVERSRLAHAAGEETMATVSALERNKPQQRRNQLTRRLRPNTKHFVFLTARAGHHSAAHST